MKADVNNLCTELETAAEELAQAKDVEAAKDACILELEAKMAEQASVTGKHRSSSPSSSKATSSADSGGAPPPAVVPNHQRSRHARLRRLTEGRGQNLRNQHTSSQVAHSSLDAYLNSLPPGNYFGNDSRQKSPCVTQVIIITETLIVNMLLYGHSIAGEIFGCKGQVL
ncbi:unnamed protein product [Cylindrotheca closterium]|uniref:Uncharacterized protein n=1 Tax=Cylindrotheca closterium TaxID=2856 RepID=A0AAD2JIL5_9STRA|nr:unnamed protein product [Cylindrotheca closterium]